MCLVHFSLEKMLEQLLPGDLFMVTRLMSRGTAAGDELGAGEKTLQGCFPSHSYLGSESPGLPVLGALCTPARAAPCSNPSLETSTLSSCIPAGLEPPSLHLPTRGAD